MPAAQGMPSLPYRAVEAAAARPPLLWKESNREKRKKWEKRKSRSQLFFFAFRIPPLSFAFHRLSKKKPKHLANARTMQTAAEKITRIFKKKEHGHDDDAASDHSEHSVHEETVEAAPAAAEVER